MQPSIVFLIEDAMIMNVFRDAGRKDRVTVMHKGSNIMFEFKQGIDPITIWEYLETILEDLINTHRTIKVEPNFYMHRSFDRYTFEELKRHVTMLLRFMMSYHTLYQHIPPPPETAIEVHL